MDLPRLSGPTGKPDRQLRGIFPVHDHDGLAVRPNGQDGEIPIWGYDGPWTPATWVCLAAKLVSKLVASEKLGSPLCLLSVRFLPNS